MHCRICNNATDNATYAVKDMMFGPGDSFVYFQCAECGCLQISVFPEDIDQFYPENYYAYQTVPAPQVSRLRKKMMQLRDAYAVFNRGLPGKWLYQRYPSVRLRSLHRLPLTRKMRILDVGCGSGSLLRSLHTLGFEDLLGVDPHPAPPSEVTMLQQDLHEMEGKWDVIMFHHSFEHLPNPRESLEQVYRLLAEGGHCLIGIPTVSSHAWEHYGVHWAQLDAPRHFFLHSLESMQRLAQAAGFKIVDAVYNSTAFQFWGSEQYKAGIPLHDERSYSENPSHSLFSRAAIRAYEAQARSLNLNKQGDQVVLYLQKQ